MTIVFNGLNNSINLGGTVFSGNANGLTDAPAGTILQTVIGTNGETSNNLVDLTGSLSNPTFLDSNCMVTITPKQSNSKILLTWSHKFVKMRVLMDMLVFIIHQTVICLLQLMWRKVRF